jgi:putative spermidine/putrescine transport system permease protein
MTEGRVINGRRGALLLLFAPGAAIIASLVLACVVLVRYSLNTWDPVRTMVPDVTLANYARVLGDPVLRRALGNTLRISAIVTACCLVIGYAVAYGISRSRRRDLLVFLLITPLLTDVLVRTYGWIVMLSQGGPVNVAMTRLGLWQGPRRLLYTELAVVLELIHELIPFMVLPIANVLERLDPALREAAMNLQAGPARTFLHVTLPLSVPGVLAGSLLVFALAMSAFSAPLLLGGGRITVMTILIQQQMFTTLDWPRGSAQSILLVVVVLAILGGYRAFLRRASGERP